ncbi:MAG: N-acyl homoserine lactonase family protein [Rhizobiales bacterium]|nr:N-acyl homoserine lactonase family protein [Hyphomicrobiales bacterium]
MKMHVLAGGRLKMRKHIYFPDVDRNESIELPVNCVLLRHPKGNVLFDTGCHPDIVTNAEERWGALARVMTPLMSPQDNVISSLQAVGLAPDDIDIVVCSHLHPDHCGCNQFFKKARILVRAEELAVARSADAVGAGYLPVEWDHPLDYQAVTNDLDLFDDGAIRLIHLPGHTQGTMGALVTLKHSGRFLLAADAVSIRANLDGGIIPKNTWNKDLCRDSFAKVRAIEADGATVICGHDDAQWQSLRKLANGYD